MFICVVKQVIGAVKGVEVRKTYKEANIEG